ncbi:MAG: hypothetical protein HQL42_16545 [Alphaproteobacteria bacterium]|nr:hypothetical protein [Alphaproteobacteria bacterium]
MRGKLTIGKDAEAQVDAEAQEIDTFSAMLPCQRFRIRASVMSNKDVPLTLEFGLRFLKTVDSASPEDLQDFFGFGPKETFLLLEDLLQPGLVCPDEDGELTLSQAGRDLFSHADPERPQMIEVEEIDESVGFDLISFSLMKRPRRAPHHRGLDELPLSDRKRASKGREAAKEAFQRAFAEYREVRWRGTTRKIYSIDDAEPEERFLAEVSVPIVARTNGGCVVEPDFTELRSLGRPGSRDPMIASVARHLHTLAWPDDASSAIDLIAQCDEGTISRFRVAGKVDPAVWIKFAMAERPPREELAPIKHLFGSVVSPRVKDAIESWLPSLGLPDRDPTNPYIWLRPRLPTWGRGAVFHDLATTLGGDGDGPGIVMLAPTDDLRADSKELRRSYEPGDRQPSPFATAFLMVDPRGLPGSLEILIDPGRWALVLIHIQAEGELKMPVPVGFLAANTTLVANIQATLRAALPDGGSWQLLWSSKGLSQKVAVSQVQRTLEIRVKSPS